MNLSQWRWISGFAFVAFLLSGAVVKAQNIESLDVKKGDTWIYKVTTRLGEKNRQETVAEVGERITVKVSGDSSLTRVTNKDGNLISAADRTYTPYLEDFDFPLVPGKEWSQSATLDVNVRRMPVSQSAKVVGWEEVNVPAGTFKALRVEYSTRFGSAGEVKRISWLVPEVRRYIKMETKVYGNIMVEDETVELVKFTPGQ